MKCVDIKRNNSGEGDNYGFLFGEQASMKSIKLYVNDPIVITGLNEILLQKWKINVRIINIRLIQIKLRYKYNW